MVRLEDGQISLRAEFLMELGNTRSAIIDRVDRLENRVTAIRGDNNVAMGSTDAAQRVNDYTRVDLRTLGEQVSVMRQQIKRLESRPATSQAIHDTRSNTLVTAGRNNPS